MTQETFGGFLTRRYHEMAIKHPGQFKSMADFGAWIGIKQSTFSTWVNNQKVPEGRNIDKLAEKLGPEVYERLGLAPKVIHEEVRLIDLIWSDLPQEERERWYKRALEIHENEQGGHRRS